MSAAVTLHGYQHSVYTWIVRMVLADAAVSYDTVEVDPFSAHPAARPSMHPFGRVPTLIHGQFAIYETGAITRYVDRAFMDGALTPETAWAQARMDQVIAIIDNYGYIPLIRQVFAHAVFRPWEGVPADRDQIAAGLSAAHPVLSSLDRIAAEGLVLNGTTRTLADCHLAPMIGYFTQADEGRAAMLHAPALMRWWDGIAQTPSLLATQPNRATQSS
jgi:glutathione S-transferase